MVDFNPTIMIMSLSIKFLKHKVKYRLDFKRQDTDIGSIQEILFK